MRAVFKQTFLNPINYPAASWRRINVTSSHRRMPVSTYESLDSGLRRNDDIRSKLRGIRSTEIKLKTSSTGFTLMEVMVALVVVAIALSALTKASGVNTSNMQYLRDKTLAHWVAMNKATELRVNQVWASTGRSNGSARMADREWYWTMIIETTPDKDLRKYVLEIRADEQDESPLTTLTGYMGNPDV